MTRKEVTALVQRLFKGGYVYWNEGDSARVDVGAVDFAVSYEHLRALADAFGTTDITLVHERGFGGSDVTPASPGGLEFLIARHKVAS